MESFRGDAMLPAAGIYSATKTATRVLRSQAVPGMHKPFRAAVISSTRNPVYAKQKLSPSHYRGLALPCVLLAFLFAGSPIEIRADSLEDAARALARKAAANLRGATVDCEERNLSVLQEAAFLSFTTTFREELQRRGVKIVKREESSRISLTLSEDLAGNIGIVSVRHGVSSEVFMESIPGSTQLGSGQSVATMGIHKELMLSQEEQAAGGHIALARPADHGQRVATKASRTRFSPSATVALGICFPLRHGNKHRPREGNSRYPSHKPSSRHSAAAAARGRGG